MSDGEDSLERAAAERRERLKALKAAKELSETPDDDDDDSRNGVDRNDDQDGLNLKFRNYLPHDKQLQEGKLNAPELPKFEDPVAAEPAAEPPAEQAEDPFLNIAPKKPNWDLRRDVQKKLDKLERRTQKALYKLMEEQEKQKQLEDGNMTAED
ncbi:uncharacterized protein LOC141605812 [Silene latifolia]|uniref:uncharacterized protein LOC141605812 n=1 Tax=Silene latifolia TaxID=37657 RepID=UPI003D77281F